MPSSAPVSSPSATKSHTWVIVLVTILVLSLGAAGAVWGFLKYSKSPEAKILTSFENLGKAKTLVMNSKIQVKGEIKKDQNPFSDSLSVLGEEPGIATTPSELTSVEFEMNINGKVDQSVPLKTALDLALKFGGSYDKKPFSSFALDIISKDSVLAFRIPSIPVVKDFDFSELNNQWITIDPKKLEEEFGSLIPPEAAEKIQAIEKDTQSDKVIESLKRTAALQPPIKVTKKYKVETMNGVKVQPYGFIINQKNAEAIIDKLVVYEKETGVTAEDATRMKEGLKDFKQFAGIIYLDQKTLLPYKLSVTFQVDPEENGQPAEDMKPINFSMVTEFKDFNKPLNISLPTDGLTLEQVTQKVMEKIFLSKMDTLQSQMSSSTNEILIPEVSDDALLPPVDTDGDGLSDSMESLYGTDKMKKDTDGDGYTDKQEIDGGYDPLTPVKK